MLLSVPALARDQHNSINNSVLCWVFDAEDQDYQQYEDTEAKACEKAMLLCQKLSRVPHTCHVVIGD